MPGVRKEKNAGKDDTFFGHADSAEGFASLAPLPGVQDRLLRAAVPIGHRRVGRRPLMPPCSTCRRVGPDAFIRPCPSLYRVQHLYERESQIYIAKK